MGKNRRLTGDTFREHIGVNEGLQPTTEILDRCQKIGFGIIRREIEWNKVEREKGILDWTQMDKYVSDCHKRGLRCMLILGKTNGIYDRSQTVPLPGNALWEPYSNFVREAVLRYNDYDVIWESWNEPNVAWMFGSMSPMQFYDNFAGVADIIRNINPDAILVGPAVGEGLRPSEDNWCYQLLTTLKKKNLLDKFLNTIDAWTGHQYVPGMPDCLNICSKEYYTLQRELLDLFGGTDIPYCTGERGFTANPKESQRYAFVLNEECRAACYVRQCLWGIHKEPRGFTINYVTYSVYDCGKGILDTDTETALSVMLNVLGDAVYVSRIDTGIDSVVLLKFEQNGIPRYAVWNQNDNLVRIALPIEPDAYLYDMMGNVQKAEGNGEYLTVTVGQTPVYIVPVVQNDQV